MRNFIELDSTMFLNLDQVVSIDIYEHSANCYVVRFNINEVTSKHIYAKGFATLKEAQKYAKGIIYAKNS